MTIREALADIHRHCGRSYPGADDGETSWADTKEAIRVLASAFEHIRNRDPLYGGHRPKRSLAPPASILPG
jgi:hypothetical protein